MTCDLGGRDTVGLGRRGQVRFCEWLVCTCALQALQTALQLMGCAEVVPWWLEIHAAKPSAPALVLHISEMGQHMLTCYPDLRMARKPTCAAGAGLGY